MRIGMILDNEFSGDTRVINEVQSLQKAGHDVSVLCFSYGEKPLKEIFCGAMIKRLPVNKWIKNKVKGLNNTFFNLYPAWWKNRILEFVESYKIDVLHVHDLWMADAAIRAARKHPIRIVLDLHENFVHALGSYRYSTTFPGNILISQERWRKSEIEWLAQVEDIIVVIEEAKQRLINLGTEDAKISVVPNYVNVEDYSREDRQLTEALLSKYQGKKVVTYTGGFDYHRGLDVLIKAARIVVNDDSSFHFVLVGGGSNEGELKQLVRELQLDLHVAFPGYLPPQQLPSYVSASDICVIPHLKNQHTDNTIPHKLFQYMLKGKPIVASNCDPLKRIVLGAECGMVYESHNPRDLANKLLSIRSSEKALLEGMGSKGLQAVLDQYNWQVASERLLRLYD